MQTYMKLDSLYEKYTYEDTGILIHSFIRYRGQVVGVAKK